MSCVPKEKPSIDCPFKAIILSPGCIIPEISAELFGSIWSTTIFKYFWFDWSVELFCCIVKPYLPCTSEISSTSTVSGWLILLKLLERFDKLVHSKIKIFKFDII